MINNSELEFNDISSEVQRTYEYPNGYKVIIDQPTHLNVSKSGGHRILDAYGKSHYIVPGFVHITWNVKEGQPNFVL
jgi:hypothetical protein